MPNSSIDNVQGSQIISVALFNRLIALSPVTTNFEELKNV